MPENEKKSLLTGAFNASVVYDLKVQKHFVSQRLDIAQNFFLIYFHFILTQKIMRGDFIKLKTFLV